MKLCLVLSLISLLFSLTLASESAVEASFLKLFELTDEPSQLKDKRDVAAVNEAKVFFEGKFKAIKVNEAVEDRIRLYSVYGNSCLDVHNPKKNGADVERSNIVFCTLEAYLEKLEELEPAYSSWLDNLYKAVKVDEDDKVCQSRQRDYYHDLFNDMRKFKDKRLLRAWTSKYFTYDLMNFLLYRYLHPKSEEELLKMFLPNLQPDIFQKVFGKFKFLKKLCETTYDNFSIAVAQELEITYSQDEATFIKTLENNYPVLISKGAKEIMLETFGFPREDGTGKFVVLDDLVKTVYVPVPGKAMYARWDKPGIPTPPEPDNVMTTEAIPKKSQQLLDSGASVTGDLGGSLTDLSDLPKDSSFRETGTGVSRQSGGSEPILEAEAIKLNAVKFSVPEPVSEMSDRITARDASHGIDTERTEKSVSDVPVDFETEKQKRGPSSDKKDSEKLDSDKGTPEKEVSIPAEEVSTSEKEVSTSEKEVSTSEKVVLIPAEEVFTSEKEVSTPEEEVSTPEEKVSTSEKVVLIPAEDESEKETEKEKGKQKTNDESKKTGLPFAKRNKPDIPTPPEPDNVIATEAIPKKSVTSHRDDVSSFSDTPITKALPLESKHDSGASDTGDLGGSLTDLSDLPKTGVSRQSGGSEPILEAEAIKLNEPVSEMSDRITARDAPHGTDTTRTEKSGSDVPVDFETETKKARTFLRQKGL